MTNLSICLLSCRSAFSRKDWLLLKKQMVLLYIQLLILICVFTLSSTSSLWENWQLLIPHTQVFIKRFGRKIYNKKKYIKKHYVNGLKDFHNVGWSFCTNAGLNNCYVIILFVEPLSISQTQTHLYLLVYR